MTADQLWPDEAKAALIDAIGSQMPPGWVWRPDAVLAALSVHAVPRAEAERSAENAQELFQAAQRGAIDRVALGELRDAVIDIAAEMRRHAPPHVDFYYGNKLRALAGGDQ